MSSSIQWKMQCDFYGVFWPRRARLLYIFLPLFANPKSEVSGPLVNNNAVLAAGEVLRANDLVGAVELL